jgi:hypothetical protein
MFFSRDKDGNWIQKRLESEKQKVLEGAKTRHIHAQIAASARWKDHAKHSDAPSIAEHSTHKKELPSRAGGLTRARRGFVFREVVIPALPKAKAKPLILKTAASASLRAAPNTHKKFHPLLPRLPAPQARTSQGKKPALPNGEDKGNIEKQNGQNAKNARRPVFSDPGKKLTPSPYPPEKMPPSGRYGPAKGILEKGPTSKNVSEPESRFLPFREEVFKFWAGQNPEAPECPWRKAENGALREALKASPKMTLKDLQTCLKHRADSMINPTALPRTWLHKIMEFHAGPLDKFGKPL